MPGGCRASVLGDVEPRGAQVSRLGWGWSWRVLCAELCSAASFVLWGNGLCSSSLALKTQLEAAISNCPLPNWSRAHRDQ